MGVGWQGECIDAEATIEAARGGDVATNGRITTGPHSQERATVCPMSDEVHLTIRYTDAGEGWVTAQVAEIPGAISEGPTREEASLPMCSTH